jgi:hypothetical protein
MATSTKVRFKLDVLTQKALEAADNRIALVREELDALGDPSTLTQTLVAWRTSQKERIEDLLAQLEEGTISNRELSAWRIQTIPTPDSSATERGRANHSLRTLQAQRADIEAKAGSLVADEDGSVALTKTQLEEFFGL